MHQGEIHMNKLIYSTICFLISFQLFSFSYNDKELEVSKTHGGIAIDCDNCHDYTNENNTNPYYLYEETINEQCYTCHDEFHSDYGQYGNKPGGHPNAGHPVEGGVDPVRPDYQFTCTSCHNPHGSLHKKMSRYKYKRGVGMCWACHSEITGNSKINKNIKDDRPWWKKILDND